LKRKIIYDNLFCLLTEREERKRYEVDVDGKIWKKELRCGLGWGAEGI